MDNLIDSWPVNMDRKLTIAYNSLIWSVQLFIIMFTSLFNQYESKSNLFWQMRVSTLYPLPLVKYLNCSSFTFHHFHCSVRLLTSFYATLVATCGLMFGWSEVCIWQFIGSGDKTQISVWFSCFFPCLTPKTQNISIYWAYILYVNHMKLYITWFNNIQ